jgi:hypothetical protein
VVRSQLGVKVLNGCARLPVFKDFASVRHWTRAAMPNTSMWGVGTDLTMVALQRELNLKGPRMTGKNSLHAAVGDRDIASRDPNTILVVDIRS